MGYACPVCGVEQADGVHLANHLAVTASLGRSDHVAWLDDVAPDWAACSPEELAARVVDHAPDVEPPEFETDGPAPPPDFESALAAQGRRAGRGDVTPEVEAVLSEARELTERMSERTGQRDEERNEVDEGHDGDAANGEENR